MERLHRNFALSCLKFTWKHKIYIIMFPCKFLPPACIFFFPHYIIIVKGLLY